MGPDVGKANARRSSKHKPYYGTLVGRVAKRKDKNVLISSHGKYMSVADLEKAKQKAVHKRAGKVVPPIIGISRHVASSIAGALAQ